MPDITMCSGEREVGDDLFVCPRKDDCYRCTAKPNKHRQAYFTEAPFHKEDGSCKYFMSNDPKPRPRDM